MELEASAQSVLHELTGGDRAKMKKSKTCFHLLRWTDGNTEKLKTYRSVMNAEIKCPIADTCKAAVKARDAGKRFYWDPDDQDLELFNWGKDHA